MNFPIETAAAFPSRGLLHEEGVHRHQHVMQTFLVLVVETAVDRMPR